METLLMKMDKTFMNEKLDFQEMKSIHEIVVTRRDIPWLRTSKRPSMMKLASISIFPEKKTRVLIRR
jgi:hypothetical protein